MFRSLILFLTLSLSSLILAHGALVDKIAAIVNNDIILLSEVKNFQKTLSLRREIDPLYSMTESISKVGADAKATMDYLVMEKLIEQNFKVEDGEVDARIREVMNNNHLSREQLDEFLRSKGFRYQDYRSIMKVGLQKKMLLDKEIRIRVNISDDDIRNHFYNTLAKTSAKSFDYSIQMIVIHKRNYKSNEAALGVAKRAHQSISQGEAFDVVAKRNSDEPDLGQIGGMGFLDADQILPAIKSSLAQMHIGSLSDVIESGDRIYIVKLVDVKVKEGTQFERQKERIREDLAKAEYTKQLRIWIERIRANAHIQINTPI